MSISPKRILVIYYNPDSPKRTRTTILQHLRTLEYSEVKHDLVYYNAFESIAKSTSTGRFLTTTPSELVNSSFDAVILHYTFLSIRTIGLPFYKWKRQFDWIGNLDCLKIAIPQDEGDFAGVLDEWLFGLGVSVIFSIQYTPEGPLYPIMRDKTLIYPCLPGYIDELIAKKYEGRLLPIAQRHKDIVYRARRLSYRWGKAGQLKYRIADLVVLRAKALGLNVDISTRCEDAIFGNQWFAFLASGKTVIGTQGGYSAIDWRGEIRVQIQALLRKNPVLTVDEVNAQMPAGWDDHRLFTVTPRHFDAIITKTCQILIEGEYKGILKANKHYISLKSDFSNLDEALEKLNDCQYLQKIVDCAYEDIYLSGQYTYRTFAKQIEDVLSKYSKFKKEEVKLMSEEESTKKIIEVLEKQLIAERHQNSLLQATLQDNLSDTIAKAFKQGVQGVEELIKPILVRIKRLLLIGIGTILVLIVVAVLLFIGCSS